MMESVIVAGKSASGTFSSLPHVRVEPEGESAAGDEPRRRISCRLPLASGRRNPSAFMCSRSRRAMPLLLAEVIALPQALKLAQLEYILDRADEAFAAGDLPPIEQSPFSAILHSLRRLGQVEWRNILEPLIVFDAVLRQDPCNVFAQHGR